MRVTDLICGAPPNPYRNGISNPLIDGLSTTIADNYPVPPKSCRPQKVRENLPQSFHSLAVSEPDPITLFTPYILFSSLPEQRPCHRPTDTIRKFLRPANLPHKTRKLNFLFTLAG